MHSTLAAQMTSLTPHVSRKRNFAWLYPVAACLLFAPSIAKAQTEAQCLSSFNVSTTKNVTYAFVGTGGQNKVNVTTMSCVKAENFRTQLYVSMDRNIYDSEVSLRSQLTAARTALSKLRTDLNSAASDASVRALMLGAAATVATVAAISTTTACASAPITGVGLAACGGAVGSGVGAVVAWDDFKTQAGTFAALKASAMTEIGKREAAIATLSQQLNAASAANMKNNYSQLFLAICRAVREQCL
jgi:hypothetical protein